MRTATFTCNGITASIRSRNRRMAITEAQYKQALRQAYPAIVEFETAMYETVIPRPLAGKEIPPERQAQYQERFDAWLTKVDATSTAHKVGAEYARAANIVITMLSRITALEGAPFHLNGTGLFPDGEVIKACENWLDDDGDPDGFWAALGQAINELDAPLTGPELKPPELLTEAEQENPLSGAPGRGNSTG